MVDFLSALLLKYVLNSYNLLKTVVDLAEKAKDFKEFPRPVIFPEESQKKRILALHLCYPLCAKYSISKYVIFKQKNKNNLSSVHINSGEVGKIIKKLDSWD